MAASENRLCRPASGGSIGEQDDTGTEGLGIDKLQVRAGAFALEQSPPVPDNRRVDEEAVLVHQSGLYQLPDDTDTSRDADLAASLVLERPHFVDEISVDDDAVVPLRIFERRGEHVLLDVVQVVRDTCGVFLLLRPVFAKR